jgi:transcriptional regulator with XRE-family HTH domain
METLTGGQAVPDHTFRKQYLRARFERHQRGWRQVDVARRTGIPQATVSAIEAGRLVPTEDELDRLAQVFAVSPAERLLQPVALGDPEEGV